MSRQTGSALLLVLVLTCSAALLVATWTVTAALDVDSVSSEIQGRARMTRLEQALAALAERAWLRWEPGVYPLGPEFEGELSAGGTSESVLHAVVRATAPGGTPSVQADLERAADGIELPRVAVVAAGVIWLPGRTRPVVVGPGDGVGGQVVVPDEGLPWALAPGCGPGSEWAVDEGTRLSLREEAGREGQTAVLVLRSAVGTSSRLPAGPLGRSAERPVVVLLDGAGTLDLRGEGRLYGVVLAPEGDVVLEGTVLHGSVAVGGRVDVGADGSVEYSDTIRTWAACDILTRVRLVPGSRRG